MRMAHGNLQEFDVSKENIYDFEKRLKFYCLGNNIKDSDETQQNGKKALFPTIIGQATFTKLRYGRRKRGARGGHGPS